MEKMDKTVKMEKMAWMDKMVKTGVMGVMEKMVLNLNFLLVSGHFLCHMYIVIIIISIIKIQPCGNPEWPTYPETMNGCL